MPIGPVATRNELADHYTSIAPYLAVYTTAPTGTTPGTEIPDVARVLVPWPDAVGGVTQAEVEIEIPAGVTVVGYGLHSAETAGTYRDGHTFEDPIGFPIPGVLTVNPSYTQV